MQQYLISLLIFIPLIAALGGTLIPSSKENFFRYLTVVVSIVQLAILFVMFGHYDTAGGLQFTEKQPWITLSLGGWGVLKAEYFVALDGLSFPLVALSVFIMLIAAISSWTIRKNVKGYFLLFLLLNAAIIGTFSSLDFLLFYLFFEFMLLPMFFLIAIWGGERREYASIKFFLYTLAGSIFILIVMIALYLSVHEPSQANTLVHSFSMINMADASNFISNSILDPNNSWSLPLFNARQWAFLLLFMGFAIKLPMVPVHTWLPDAHVEAPTPVSVILAAILLKIGGYGLARIALPIFPEAAIHFSSFIAIMGVISIVYGALNAMASKDLKRLIAYSSVSHMGFVLLGLAAVTEEGISGALYQMVSHGIVSAMLFILVGVIYDRTHDRTISNYSGLSSKMKKYTAFVLVGFFASMGLPGFSGFIAEILVFLGAFRAPSANGLLHESFAVIATLGLILGAAYYLWTLQRMFFGPFDVKGQIDPNLLTDLDRREYLMLVPLAVLTFLFGVYPQPLIDLIDPFARELSDMVLSAGKGLILTP
jgi:NADH-quinone oxidoreductase subunit M